MVKSNSVKLRRITKLNKKYHRTIEFTLNGLSPTFRSKENSFYLQLKAKGGHDWSRWGRKDYDPQQIPI